ncbi:hypothetical protein M0638_08365 [Roseomonas sp. NAR14]|uniref:Uncharacterized protein n=1 Tax=Roseomonas acroporae TaxID=2937791 RepID=A0A9X1Y770_9PROT|nr:hypothetical protein [Roseomonas acroporae]MCK8784390.1 hypothetical protein [Roseomonas acroporae]
MSRLRPLIALLWRTTLLWVAAILAIGASGLAGSRERTAAGPVPLVAARPGGTVQVADTTQP